MLTTEDGKMVLQVYGREFRYRPIAVEPKIMAFLSKVDFESQPGCWLWTGALTHQGYGTFGFNGSVRAHRFAYQLLVGDIPAGKHLHHKTEDGCVGPACVNPAHLLPLDPDTHAKQYTPMSLSSINAERTHCDFGHELAGDNLYVSPRGRRRCMECRREWQRTHYAMVSALDRSKRTRATHCKKGHEYTPENTYVYAGVRQCRTCHAELTRQIAERKRRAAGIPKKGEETHCKRGHEFTPENTAIEHGRRRCIACRKANAQENARKKREAAGPRTHCKHGHEWIPENLMSVYHHLAKKQILICAVCHRENNKKNRQLKREMEIAAQ